MKSFAPVSSNNMRVVSPTLLLCLNQTHKTHMFGFLFWFGSRQTTFCSSAVILVEVLGRMIKTVMVYLVLKLS